MVRSSALNQLPSMASYLLHWTWYTSLPLVVLWDTIISILYAWLSPEAIGSGGSYWLPLGKYGSNKLTWKTMRTPLTFPVSYNLYAVFQIQIRTSNSPTKRYCNLEEPGSLKFLVDNKTLSSTYNSTTLWCLS